MLVTLLGIVILVKPLQYSNAAVPMLVTPLPIVILVKPLQPPNAQPPMLVTVLGIVILVIAVWFRNASVPMLVTGRPKIVAGIVTAPPAPVYPVRVIALPLMVKLKTLEKLSVLNFRLAASTVIAVKPLQPPNAPSPILVTLAGMVMLVKPLQP